MKRHRGDLEAETGHQQNHTQGEEPTAPTVGQRLPDGGQISRTGGAIDEGHAVVEQQA